MKNSKSFKKILSTSLASLTALSTLSGSISTKIYAQDPEVQANSTKSEGRYGLGFSYQGHNFFVIFNESNQEVAEKFKNTLHKVMEEELGQYSTKIEEKEKAIFLDVQEPSFIEWIKNICSLEKPAEQKANIEHMFNLIVKSYLKNTKLVANDSAKEAQTEKPAAKVEPIVESSTEEAQAEVSVKENAKVEPIVESSTEETQTEASVKETAKVEPIVESSTEETQTEASVKETAKVEPIVESSTEETQSEASVEEAAKVEPVVNDSTEEAQTEAPAEGTPLIEIESSAEETKEESTAPAKEKKSLLNKILNFLKKLPLIGKLFKFLFK